MNVQFPEKLKFLFQPARYKGIRGGRGSGKSWGVARALLIIGASKPTRILCTREVQKSIQQSVHQLLKDQVTALGLDSFYEILQTEIRGKNGTCFYFAGLSDQTADSLKSFEGVNVCWLEEAQSITKRSWDILVPTIRATGSEIWATYNPQLDTDETHQRLVVKPAPDCICVEMNYSDNPWFPEVLEKERVHAKEVMRQEDYLHIWEGHCKPAVEGAIYFESMAQTLAGGRICRVPHDGNLKTHLVWDLGMADSMTIILVQKVASEIRVIHYIEGNQRILADYSAELKALKLDDQVMNWGKCWLPHDGFHTKHQTGKSDSEILQGLGWQIGNTPNVHVSTGIDRAREMFPRVYFNDQRSARLIECLKRYRWNISNKTGEALSPLHDEFSHACLDGETLILTRSGNVKIKDVAIGEEVWTPAGYAKVLNSGPTKLATELIEITMADGTQIIATPDHRVFTTNGVVIADALRYNDAIFTKDSAPCISYQSIKSVGYRDAVIASFEAKNTGIGSVEKSMARKLAAKLAFCIARYTEKFMESRISVSRLARWMGTSQTLSLQTGKLFEAKELASIRFKNSMVCGSTSSQRVTSRQILSDMAASPCIAMSGTISMVKFQMGFTSITLMATKLTTTLETLSCYLRQIIQSITLQRMSGVGAKLTLSRLGKLASWLRCGTLVKKVKNGTESTVSTLGKKENGTNASARNAGLNSSAHTQAAQSTAMQIAKLRRLEGEEAIRLVYDLTVEKHHCYLANGLLVSNCDAFRYLALVEDQLTNEDWGGALKYPGLSFA